MPHAIYLSIILTVAVPYTAWGSSKCADFFLRVNYGLTQVDSYGRQIIPEVASLLDHDAIPTRIVDAYDSKVIGESVVHRLSVMAKNDPAARPGTIHPALAQKMRVQILVNERDVESILRNGMMNQHQTGKASNNARLDLATRTRVESKLASLELREELPSANSSKIKEILPKYGILSFLPEGYGLRPRPVSELKGYGNVVIQLKPEVLRRTTYTEGDSLRAFEYMPKEFVRPHVQFFGEDSLVAKNAVTNNFFETQVWGRVDINDIEMILFDPSANPSPEFLKIAKQHKIRVTLYLIQETFGVSNFVPFRN